MRNLLIVLLFAVCSMANAQDKINTVVTATLTVHGNCGECKERIETAADIKGVKNSRWDAKAQTLTVTYRSDKVTIDEIKQAILKSGHDVADQKAPDAVYNKLPKCCQFRDTKCEK